MAAQPTKSIYLWRNVRATLLGLAAVCGAASPLFAQDTLAEKFTLTESLHFGSKILREATNFAEAIVLSDDVKRTASKPRPS